MQTGRYATTTGCFRNGIPLPPRTFRPWRTTFGTPATQTGYIGKWHLAADEPVPEAQRGGYEYWLAANLLEFTSDAYRHRGVRRRVTSAVQAAGLPRRRPDRRRDPLRRRSTRHEPFFLFLSFLEPHHQNHRDDYPAPDGYASATPAAGCRRTWRRWAARRRSTWAATTAWSSGWTRRSAGCSTRSRAWT